MDLQSLLDSASDSMSIKRVFGEPIERDGVLVIPAAVVAGGGGGGQREAEGGDHPGKETGGGFGMWARPIGVYVVRDGQVEFRPAIDILPLAILGVFLMNRLLRRRAKRRK